MSRLDDVRMHRVSYREDEKGNSLPIRSKLAVLFPQLSRRQRREIARRVIKEKERIANGQINPQQQQSA